MGSNGIQLSPPFSQILLFFQILLFLPFQPLTTPGAVAGSPGRAGPGPQRGGFIGEREGSDAVLCAVGYVVAAGYIVGSPSVGTMSALEIASSVLGQVRSAP